MSYLVFARKFRPQDFDEILGQEPIVTTLKNAIRQDRIPQNFLFCGPRGVGKTSAARILAKALNCAKGPTENPCGKCTACVEITQGNSLDVLEIDGASNRGIDEIRNLRETVKFKPVTGRVKIYIIDEVHMLTAEAFNALLKTLEEPPPHVKFVFATTEPHKVPLTILSRCHRFNFKRIPVQEIAGKLKEIAKKEKLQVESNVPFLIAKASDGALRDAEGLLDQLASFAGGKITEKDVLFMLGLAAEEIYFKVLTALCQRDARQIFSLVAELHEGGKDLVQFARGLLEVFRHLLLLQCAQKAEEFIEMSEEGIGELEKRKNDFSRSELLLALSLLSNLQGQLRRNLAPARLLVEIVLLKLLHLEGLKGLDALNASPASLERQSPSGGLQKGLEKSPALAPQNPSFGAQVPAVFPASQQAPSMPRSEDLSLEQAESAWPRVVEYVKTKRMSAGIFLSESSPVEVADSVITLGLPAEFQFHKEMLEKQTNRQLVEEAFEVVLGLKVRIQFVVTKPEAEKVSLPGLSQPASEESGKLPDVIMEALNIFEGSKIIRKE